MGLLDLFRPRWKHSDPTIRAEAIKDLSSDDLPRLSQVARHDSDPRVRRIALKKITDLDLLDELAKRDPDEGLRRDAADKANELLLEAALDQDDEEGAVAAVKRLSAARTLVDVACRAAFASVKLAALDRVSEDRHLIDVARRAEGSDIRLRAVEKLESQEALRDLLLGDVNKEIAQRALARIKNRELLTDVAQRARGKAVRTAARERLGIGVVTAKSDAAPAVSKNAAPIEASDPLREQREKLCQRLEVAAKSDDPADYSDAEEVVAAARAAWQAIGGGEVPTALRKRFERAIGRFQERRESLTRKQQKGQGPVPRLAAVLPPQSAPVARKEPPASAPVVEKVVERVTEKIVEKAPEPPPIDPEELKRRELSRLRREEDRKQREAEQAEKLRAAEEKRAVEEKLRGEAQAKNLARIEEQCARLESLAQGEKLRGKQVEQALKQAHEVVVQANPLPRDRSAAARQRYDAARAALVIKLHELREREDWERWSNIPKLDLLCQKIELLYQALEGGHDRAEVAAVLKDLQTEWKSVGPAPKDKSEALWQRFKEKGDQIYDKLRAATDEERAVNLKKKEELCEKIDALKATLATISEPSGWKSVAEQLKALQSEWKASGPTPTKEQADALWQRFKASADAVYAEQKAHYAELDGERAENLKKKEALCLKVEAAIYSTDWKGTTELLKTYQADWKAIGHAPRAEQEALWQRFRTACDKFFERRQAAFAKLDEERQGNLKLKEALCEQAEALVAKEDLAQDAAESEIKRLQSEWKRIGPVPQQQSETSWQRFRGSCDQIFARGRQYETMPVATETADGQPVAKFSNKLPLEGLLARLNPESESAKATETSAPHDSPAASKVSPPLAEPRAADSWENAAASGWEDIDKEVSASTPDPEAPSKKSAK